MPTKSVFHDCLAEKGGGSEDRIWKLAAQPAVSEFDSFCSQHFGCARESTGHAISLALGRCVFLRGHFDTRKQTRWGTR